MDGGWTETGGLRTGWMAIELGWTYHCGIGRREGEERVEANERLESERDEGMEGKRKERGDGVEED